MSFQYVFDNAASMSMDRMKVVATTTARDGTTRSVSRGGQYWRFTVRLPDGDRWTNWRSKISELEKLDKVTNDTIQLNNYDYLSGYQGDCSTRSGFVANIVEGSDEIVLTSTPSLASGNLLKAGDLLQLGSSGKVYTVAADVAYNETTVTLHRPVLESTTSGVTLSVGQDCSFTVKCVQFPKWDIFAYDQVSWSDAFVFHEVL